MFPTGVVRHLEEVMLDDASDESIALEETSARWRRLIEKTYDAAGDNVCV